MGSKGGGSNTTSTPNATSAFSGSSPPPNVQNAYNQLISQVQGVGSQPLQQYQGPLVAPFNNTQNAAFNQINNSTGLAQPAIGMGEGLVAGSGMPITPQVTGTTQQFMDPYLNSAVGATEAQMKNINQQQQEQLTGQAIGAGAYGGDRAGIAAGNLANQQSLAEGQVIGGMENQGYQSAEQAAINTLESDSNRMGQAGTELGALGNESQAASLAGANAQLGAGTLQQQLAQENLNIPYEQFIQQQAFPYQTTGWETSLIGELGGLSGGTSYTTPTPPNPYTTYAGLGLAGIGTLGAIDTGLDQQSGATGGRMIKKASGGESTGLLPPDVSTSWIPNTPFNAHASLPAPPGGKGGLTSNVNPTADLEKAIPGAVKAIKKMTASSTPADNSNKVAGWDANGNPVDANGNIVPLTTGSQPVATGTNWDMSQWNANMAGDPTNPGSALDGPPTAVGDTTGSLSPNITSGLSSANLPAVDDYTFGAADDVTIPASTADVSVASDTSSVGSDISAFRKGGRIGKDLGGVAKFDSSGYDPYRVSAVSDVMDMMPMEGGGRIHLDYGGTAYDFESGGYSPYNAPPSGAESILIDTQDEQFGKLADLAGSKNGGRIHKPYGGSAGDDNTWGGIRAIDTSMGDDDVISTSLPSETLSGADDNVVPQSNGFTNKSDIPKTPDPKQFGTTSTTTQEGTDNTLGTILQVAGLVAAVAANKGGRVKRKPRDLGGATPGLGGLAPQDPARQQMIERLMMQKRMMPNAGMPVGQPGMQARPNMGAFGASPMQQPSSTGGAVGPMDFGVGFARGGNFGEGGLVARGFADGGDADDEDTNYVLNDDDNEDVGYGMNNSGQLMPIADVPLPHKQVAQVDEPTPGVAQTSFQGDDVTPPSSDKKSNDSKGVSAHDRFGSPWTALAAAGFGMAGANTPFAGQAIAQGAGAGLKQLHNQADAETKAQQLHQAAEKAQQQFAAQEKHYSVMQTNAARAADAAQANAAAKARLATVAEATKDAQVNARNAEAQAAQTRAAAAQTVAGRGNFTMREGQGPDPTSGAMVDGTWTIDSHTGNKTFQPGVSVSSGKPGAVEHLAGQFIQENAQRRAADPTVPQMSWDEAVTQARAHATKDNTENALRSQAQNYAKARMTEIPQNGQPQQTYDQLLAQGFQKFGLDEHGRLPTATPTAVPRPTPTVAPTAPPVAAPQATPTPTPTMAPTAQPPAAAAKPPIEGARQGKDGNWYVANPNQPDPAKPGHYLRVVPKTQPNG